MGCQEKMPRVYFAAHERLFRFAESFNIFRQIPEFRAQRAEKPVLVCDARRQNIVELAEVAFLAHAPQRNAIALHAAFFGLRHICGVPGAINIASPSRSAHVFPRGKSA